MMFLDNDIYMGRMLAEFGEYSESEIDLLGQIVRPGDVVIDAGANIGCLTIPLAKKVGPSGTILAFEPQRFLYYMLCGNIAMNALKQAHAFHKALGAVEGVVSVPDLDYTAEQNFGGMSLRERWDGYPVPIVTIDSMFDQLPALRLLKADVEGMETEILTGARETIAKHRPFLYVENERPDNSERLLGIMRDMEYRLYDHTTPYLPEGNGLFGCAAGNVLGVPKELNPTINLKELNQ
jgi:FkbM family methyltransferase